MRLETPAVVEGNPLVRVELPMPRAGAGEIRLRVLACGVCRTDLHTVEGDLDLPRLPIVPGHQAVGAVDEVGEGVERFRVGDRAGVAWLHQSCGRCRFCASGRENLCEGALFTGLHVDGGYAGYLTARADFAYRIPPQYADHEAAPLLCAGIIGYRALKLSGIRETERLGLYGFGASAHIAIQVARLWGCEVYVFSRAGKHRRLAERLGARWVGHSSERAPERLHGAIIFAPAGSLIPPALEGLERGGRLVLAGIEMSTVPELNYRRHLYHERSIASVANATRRDAEEFFGLAEQNRLAVHTELFPLADANSVLQSLKGGHIRASAVLAME